MSSVFRRFKRFLTKTESDLTANLDSAWLAGKVAPKGKKVACTHDRVSIRYNDEDMNGLTSNEVRERFPRFQGNCPSCGESLIMYSSTYHYVMGDW